MSERKEETGQFLTMPIIPLRGITILPSTVMHFDLNKEKSVQALEYAMAKGGKIFLLAQRESVADAPEEEHLYRVGTIAVIKQITKLPNQIVRVLVEGIGRGILRRINLENSKFLEAHLEVASEGDIMSQIGKVEEEAMLRQLKEHFAVFATHYPKLDKNAVNRYSQIKDIGTLIDQIAMNLPMSYD